MLLKSVVAMVSSQSVGCLSRSLSNHRAIRAGVRLQRLSSTLGSSIAVDSLHSAPYRDHDPSAKRLLRLQQQRRSVESSAASEPSAMAQQKAQYAYTTIYVPDVQQAVDFYDKAFGFKCRFVDHSKNWGELESGSTTISFTPMEQRETKITGGVHVPDLSEPQGNVQVAFSYEDVDAAFKHATEAGAVPVAQPEDKPWGQRVGYVRDINGVMIRMGSIMKSR